MTVITNGSEPIFSGEEVALDAVELEDSVPQGAVFHAEFVMRLLTPTPGGFPTDPNYCWSLSNTAGRKVNVTAIVANRVATDRDYCIDSLTGDRVGMDVPLPDGVDIGEANVNFYFTMADTTEPQWPDQSFEGASESTVATSISVTESSGGTGGDDSPEWREVDPSEEVSVGDKLKLQYGVEAPDIPFNELIAKMQIEAAKLTGEINSELSCIDTRVDDTTFEPVSGIVVDGREVDYLYTVELTVTGKDETCGRDALTYSSIPGAVVIAVAILVAGVGVSLVLWRTEKLFSGESGERVQSTLSGPLLLGGAFLVLNELGDDDG